MKISTVIVTFNRLELLKKCLEAVFKQSVSPSMVYVVDNASTDGTIEYLNNLSSTRNDICCVSLSENIGGSGGFYLGLKKAFEEGNYDAYWLMDDDGMPDEYCLENMSKYLSEYAFLSPLVLNIEDHSEMAFNTLKFQNVDIIKSNYPNGVIENHSNPFNGILLRKDLVEKVGYPLKDMFIWGDENEYEARIKANGFIYATIINAIHFHPKDRLVAYPDFLGKRCIVYVDSELKRYCKYRNFAYVLYKYKHWYNVGLYIFRYTYFYLLNRKFDTKGLIFFYKAVKDGLNNNFENHKKYIQ